jgi:hypothetical protein
MCIKNQQSQHTGSRNLMGPNTLPTTWGTYMKHDRNLIFCHKLHIGMPYCGKRFWTRQIPTSCMPTLLIFIHIEHICAFFVALIWRVQKRYPQYGIPIWCLWPNIRFQPSTVTEKNKHGHHRQFLFLIGWLYPRSPKGKGVYCFTSVRPSVRPR